MPNTVLFVAIDADNMGSCNEAVPDGVIVTSTSSLAEASVCVANMAPQAVIMDVTNLSPNTCVEYIKELSLTDFSDVAWLVDETTDELDALAKAGGISAMFEKPVAPARMDALAAFLTDALDDETSLNSPPDSPQFGDMYGSSPASRKLFRLLRRVAPSEASVLLIGESGTGKELAASALHDNSARAGKPFVAINCGAIPSELMESELFGHRKGAFTGADREHVGFFEQANGGTLFLDEITEMAAELQVKLLRVLETGTFRRVGDDRLRKTDVRIVAATNRQPNEAIADGELREDVYYRVAEFPVNLPPLRSRGQDTVLLAHRFLEGLNQQNGTALEFSESALDKILVSNWPGNIRELRNAIGHACIIAEGKIQPDDIPDSLAPGSIPEGNYLQVGVGSSLEDAERELIFATLEKFDGNRQKTAETLGVSVKTVYNKLQQYEHPAISAGK